MIDCWRPGESNPSWGSQIVAVPPGIRVRACVSSAGRSSAACVVASVTTGTDRLRFLERRSLSSIAAEFGHFAAREAKGAATSVAWARARTR